MYPLLICIGIGIWIMFKKRIFSWDKEELIFVVFMTIFCAICGGFILSLITSSFLPTEHVHLGTMELVAIEDSSSISGSFFIGSGQIDAKFIYTYYYKSKSGAIYQTYVPVNSTALYEWEKNKGVVREYRRQTKKEFKRWTLPIDNSLHYEIFIPRGSIRRNFNFDLK